MEPAPKTTNDNFLSLKHTAKIFGVTVEDLLEWNNNNILKPTISQSGEVGYTNEQIDIFLTLQNLIRSKNNARNPSTNTWENYFTDKQNNNNGTSPNSFQDSTKINQNQLSDNLGQGSAIAPTPSSKLNHRYDKHFWVALVATVAITIVSFTFTSNNHRTDPSTSNNSLETDTIAKQLSTITLPYINNEIFVDSNTINNTSINDASDLATALYFDDQQYGSEEIKAVPPTINMEAENDIDSSIVNNFASRPNTAATTGNNKFDESTLNISEEMDALSMKLGTATMHYDSHPTTNALSFNILIVAIFLSLLWIVYAYKNRYSIAILNLNSNTSDHGVPPNHIQITHTLEVVQKLDGTVSIVFGDNEYKVSKPELNSETDRLIQRLMKLTSDEQSEIHYDVLVDKNMELNAPLSKIVTRLGFVGTKRDLFFPRTSKNKVVFRRRLTPQNLRSLKLTEEQLLQELLN